MVTIETINTHIAILAIFLPLIIKRLLVDTKLVSYKKLNPIVYFLESLQVLYKFMVPLVVSTVIGIYLYELKNLKPGIILLSTYAIESLTIFIIYKLYNKKYLIPIKLFFPSLEIRYRNVVIRIMLRYLLVPTLATLCIIFIHGVYVCNTYNSVRDISSSIIYIISGLFLALLVIPLYFYAFTLTYNKSLHTIYYMDNQHDTTENLYETSTSYIIELPSCDSTKIDINVIEVRKDQVKRIATTAVEQDVKYEFLSIKGKLKNIKYIS